MLSKEKLERIGVLSNKAKGEGLTDAELKEQKTLREEYLKTFRKSFKQRLDNIDITYVDELPKKN
ncbi:MAG: DUF896 domain-containing protein [Acidaminobacteraceae bacterium]